MPIELKRDWIPEIGWPVYDLRSKKFGICIDFAGTPVEIFAIIHVEGNRLPQKLFADQKEFEYPKYYINDEVEVSHDEIPSGNYFIKHVHYHVPRNVWQYTIAKQGIEGFDRFVIEGHDNMSLLKSYISPI